MRDGWMKRQKSNSGGLESNRNGRIRTDATHRQGRLPEIWIKLLHSYLHRRSVLNSVVLFPRECVWYMRLIHTRTPWNPQIARNKTGLLLRRITYSVESGKNEEERMNGGTSGRRRTKKGPVHVGILQIPELNLWILFNRLWSWINSHSTLHTSCFLLDL